MNLNEWMVFGNVGVSSKTMWAAITGAVTEGKKGWTFDVPHDPSDFSRCLEFYEQCNLTTNDLQKVKKVFKWWAPFVDNWEKMVALWNEELPTGSAPKLYKYMQELEDESRILDGWVKTGPGSWQRKQ